MSEEEIKDELLIMFFVGYEIIVLVLVWVLYWIDKILLVRENLMVELVVFFNNLD